MNNDINEEVSKGGNKDLGKLTPQKKTVIRNGKPMETTIYVDGDQKEQSDDKPKAGTEEEQAPVSNLASNMTKKTHDTQPKLTSSEMKELGVGEADIISANDSNKSNKENYVTLTDDEGKKTALITYLETDKYIVMLDIASNDTVIGAGVRGFYEACKLAVDAEKGVSVSDDMGPNLGGFAEDNGMKLNKDGDWVLEANEVAYLFKEDDN